MSDRTTLFELKEKAKWSADPKEKKAAIKELSTHGQAAVPQLEEILTITAYEEIRTACAEAIRAILANSKQGGETAAVSKNNPPTTANAMSSKSQKKEEKEKQESVAANEPRLADLPP